jgi:hypothetical protein
MQFVIEPEGAKFHWVVKCMEKGKLVELHRFYLSLENFLHHRGAHGKLELDAMKALQDYFAANPGEKQTPPLEPRNLSLHVEMTK